MKLFMLDCINVDRRYCRIDAYVSCIVHLLQGTPAKPEMERVEEDFLELEMNEVRGGLELPDYVSNTNTVLPLRKACAEAIVTNFEVGEHELLPAKLINSKERVHSDDYVVLNPLGRVDALNTELSDMDGDEDDPTVQVMGKWCAYAEKIPERDLFRIRGVTGYIFSERLVEFIKTQGYTNFAFKPVTLC